MRFILRGVAVSALCLEVMAQLWFSLPATPDPVKTVTVVAPEPVWRIVHPSDIPECSFTGLSDQMAQSHSSGWWCVAHNNNAMDVR